MTHDANMTLSDAEREFLAAQGLVHLTTIARDGFPQVKPVGCRYNAELGTIDVAGFNMAASAKYKNVQQNPKVALVADDRPAPDKGAAGVRFLEIRGVAETATVPPGPGDDGHLAPEIIRIHPRRVLGFNVDPDRPGLMSRDVGGESVIDDRWPA